MNQPSGRITWEEICVAGLVLVVSIAVIYALAVPALNSGGLKRSPMTQVLSNMMQLQRAMVEMEKDSRISGNTDFDWTCTNGGPMTTLQWKDALIRGNYLTESDFDKLTEGGPRSKRATNVIAIYAVNSNDQDTTLLFSTKNWHGITNYTLYGEPFGTYGAIFFQKGGSGTILLPSQATNPEAGGTGGTYNYLPLK